MNEKNVGPRVVVVGGGHWGKNLVRDFHGLGALKAIVETNAETAAALAKTYDVPIMSFKEALADDNVDGMVLAVPAEFHGAAARRVIEAGKHCYVEKPLSLDLQEAKDLVVLGERRGVQLMVGHLLQYHPAFMTLKEEVNKGRLGRLHYIYSHRCSFGIFRRKEDALWSLAPHDISMVLSLANEAPAEVECTGTSVLHQSIPDFAQMQFAFGSGLKGHIFCSWLHPFKEQRLVVIGEKGALVFEDSAPAKEDKLKFYGNHVEWLNGAPVPRKQDAVPVPFGDENPLQEECRHFLHCIATNTTPRTDGHESVRVLDVLTRSADAMAGNAQSQPNPQTFANRFPSVKIHDSAFVDDGVIIGAGTKIWHVSHILGGTTIGTNVSIGQNVVAGPNVRIGNNVKIQNNVSVYEGVTLEDDVFCGPSCVFTNVINPRSRISRKNEYLETVVRRGATIGANATIVCGHSIGAYAFIAAGAVITRDVPDYALMAGVPAKRIGWMSKAGIRLGDDLVCPQTGTAYIQKSPDKLEEASP